MEFTDADKAARAASIEEFPYRPKRARPKWAKPKGRRRLKPKTFGEVLDNFEANIRESYREGWSVDMVILPVSPKAYRMLHIKRASTIATITAKLNRRGLTVTSVHSYGTDLWFLVSP